MVKVLKLWNSFFDWLVPVESSAAWIWSKYWRWTLICCSLSVFIRSRLSISREWIMYLPAGVLCEVVLIYLLVRFPFSEDIKFWKMAILPAIGIWLPYVILAVGSPPLAFLSQVIEKLLDWKGFPRFAPPWAYSNGVMNALVCFGLTAIVIITAFAGAWSSIRKAKEQSKSFS